MLAVDIIEGKRGAEGTLENVHSQVSEPEIVGFVNEAILEDAGRFVCPQLGHGLSTLHTLRVAHENALNNLTHITQVEHVVELCRSGTQILLDLGVDLNSTLNNRGRASLHRLLETTLKEAVQDAGENLR
jgi:hypothetical protein